MFLFLVFGAVSVLFLLCRIKSSLSPQQLFDTVNNWDLNFNIFCDKSEILTSIRRKKTEHLHLLPPHLLKWNRTGLCMTVSSEPVSSGVRKKLSNSQSHQSEGAEAPSQHHRRRDRNVNRSLDRLTEPGCCCLSWTQSIWGGQTQLSYCVSESVNSSYFTWARKMNNNFIRKFHPKLNYWLCNQRETEQRCDVIHDVIIHPVTSSGLIFLVIPTGVALYIQFHVIWAFIIK